MAGVMGLGIIRVTNPRPSPLWSPYRHLPSRALTDDSQIGSDLEPRLQGAEVGPAPALFAEGYRPATTKPTGGEIPRIIRLRWLLLWRNAGERAICRYARYARMNSTSMLN